jgi:hypothetical protein
LNLLHLLRVSLPHALGLLLRSFGSSLLSCELLMFLVLLLLELLPILVLGDHLFLLFLIFLILLRVPGLSNGGAFDRWLNERCR